MAAGCDGFGGDSGGGGDESGGSEPSGLSPEDEEEGGADDSDELLPDSPRDPSSRRSRSCPEGE